MNTAAAFLRENWERLALERFGSPDELTTLVLTPRFRASSHVLFLVSTAGEAKPTFAVKIPRLPRLSSAIQREADNLRAVQSSRDGGFETVPRVLAFERFAGRPILVETALHGRPMNPEVVRGDRERCCRTLSTWLLSVQRPSSRPAAGVPDWYARVVEAPLEQFRRVFPLNADERTWVEQTLDLGAVLRKAEFPLVFEHGDLCHPNILMLEGGEAGVIDWELAEPMGLPVGDLLFFCTYVASACANPDSTEEWLFAFDQAFLTRDAWARPCIEDYADRLGVPRSLVQSLFVLFWGRYLAKWVLRLHDGGDRGDTVSPDTATWLRARPYYALWRHALQHADRLAA